MERLTQRYRDLCVEREEHTFSPVPESLTSAWFVCAGCGPSLNQFNAGRIQELGASLLCTNSAGLWAEQSVTEVFGQVISDSERLLSLHVDPFRSPTWIMPYYLTKEWLSVAEQDEEYRILKTDMSLERNHPMDAPKRYRPEMLLFPSYDLRRDGINICGYSVIFQAIQVAVHLGAKRITLIGTEMDYSGPKTHFRPTVHQNPDYRFETHSRLAMICFRDSLAAKGITLTNATPGGAIDVLERTDPALLLPA